MICYEIWLNGEKLCKCGHEDMHTLQASIFCSGDSMHPNMVVSAILNTTDKLKNDARWALKELGSGDEIKIGIVECSNPDKPEITKSFGTRLHPTSKKELFCSFCGRSEHDVEKIFEGMGGNICTDCAKICIE